LINFEKVKYVRFECFDIQAVRIAKVDSYNLTWSDSEQIFCQKLTNEDVKRLLHITMFPCQHN